MLTSSHRPAWMNDQFRLPPAGLYDLVNPENRADFPYSLFQVQGVLAGDDIGDTPAPQEVLLGVAGFCGKNLDDMGGSVEIAN